MPHYGGIHSQGGPTVPQSIGFANGQQLPRLIQGGMGVGVSHYRLACAVASLGHLGVVSGTAIDAVLARRLQDGDPTGEMREAMALFPRQDIAERALARYFRADGRDGRPYRGVPMHTLRD